jgi:hypothetical protein
VVIKRVKQDIWLYKSNLHIDGLVCRTELPERKDLKERSFTEMTGVEGVALISGIFPLYRLII